MSLCFDQLCRTCMSAAPAMLSIHEPSDIGTIGSGSPTITDMLMAFTTINISKDDGLPESICIACISEINRSFSFKQKCERSEATFKTYLLQLSRNADRMSNIATVDQQKPKEELIESSEIIQDDFSHLIKSESSTMCNVHETNNDSFEATDEEQMTVDVIEDNDDEHLMESESVKADPTVVFQCPVCLNLFSNKPLLRRHMTTAHDASYCDPCDLYFDSVEELTEHGNTLHSVEMETQSADRESFVENKPELKKWKCPECDGEFAHQKSLHKHISRFHLEKVTDKAVNHVGVEIESTLIPDFKCSKCGATFAQERSLNNHQKSNRCNVESFPCTICSRVFIRKRNLNVHMATHENQKMEKSENDSRQMVQRGRLTGNEIKKKHQCPHCAKSFSMMSTLKDHIRIHNGERPFLCSVCGKGFSQSTNLKQHMMRHTKTKPFKCNICEYSFVSKGELEAHIRKHTGAHPFVCETCGAGFTTSSSLVKHKRIHSGERPYACEFCPMRFTALGTLKNHRRTHTGERPFQCEFCKKTFAQKSDMVSHTRTHTGERPYVCSICSQAFLQSSTLRTHLKTHQARVAAGERTHGPGLAEPTNLNPVTINAKTKE